MTDERVLEFTRDRFGPDAQVEMLAGDASDRCFYRLKAPNLSSLVLMVHPEPFDLESLPYFLHGCFLHELGASVPQIVASYPTDGVLVLQDLGNDTLQLHLAGCGPARRRFLYLQAVQVIALLQREGTPALSDDLPAASTALDRQRLHFEMRFFMQHFVDGLLGSPMPAARIEYLDQWLGRLARRVARYPRVLCHRDFHSRNLMVKGDRLFMVDFQDLRQGPYTYDLASLIHDSYITLPEDLTREMIQFYREIAEVSEVEEVFGRSLAHTALQRNIKAIGSFAYQAVAKDNKSYLTYILPTLASVSARLAHLQGDPENTVEEKEALAEIRAVFEGPLSFPG
jgi:aminoglycoside/choline kinase family phosphotransferase